MELISKEAVIQITKKYDATIYDAAMWCRKEIEELKTYTPLGSVLDRIRAEIAQKIVRRPWLDFEDMERDRNDAFLEVLDIIDRYNTESEEGGE